MHLTQAEKERLAELLHEGDEDEEDSAAGASAEVRRLEDLRDNICLEMHLCEKMIPSTDSATSILMLYELHSEDGMFIIDGEQKLFAGIPFSFRDLRRYLTFAFDKHIE